MKKDRTEFEARQVVNTTLSAAVGCPKELEAHVNMHYVDLLAEPPNRT